MRRLTLLAGFMVLVLPVVAAAQPRATDPNWPCEQPLVPTLTAGLLWGGPPLEDLGDWHKDPAVAEVVSQAAPQEVTAQQGEAAIAKFVKNLGADRTRQVGLAFLGLLDETNQQRSVAIERIKDLAQRQRNLAALVSRLTAQLDAIPADDQARSAERNDLLQRWTFTSRTFTEVQKTMRYACEIPATMDGRLGAYARALQASLK